MSHNFNPFYDYEDLTDEMVEDLHDDLWNLEEAKREFIASPSKDTAAEYMKSLSQIDGTCRAIGETIYKVPAMIHVAGPTKHEVNPDNPEEEATIQRCARCGSVLHWWHEGMIGPTPDGVGIIGEDDFQWWEEGQTIGKIEGPGPIHMSMYSVEDDHELQSHERECVDISGLEEQFEQ